ncbi:MAG: signal peptidase I [Candidatus Doudnabacteria bacterium]|nr:signal peptidase I [Candidatus Doudnabacteria bacterium]
MDNIDNPFFEQPAKPKRSGGIVVDMLQSIVVALFICIVLYLFILTPNQVDGYSMCPNFEDAQLLLTNKLSVWLGSTPFGQSMGLDYQRGDIVVFQKPDREKALVKRVIAIGGDKVSIRDGRVYVNGERLLESYLPPERRTNGGSYLAEGEEVTIDPGFYFLMGDNRNNSLDSRFNEIGQIKREWLQGKVILTYWPLSTFGLISSNNTAPKTLCPVSVQK